MCPEVLRSCPNNCDKTLQWKLADVSHLNFVSAFSIQKQLLSLFLQMECHLDPVNGDCPLVEVFCPYAYYGCEFKVGIEIDTAYDNSFYIIQHMRKEECVLQQHLNDLLRKHASMTVDFDKRVERTLNHLVTRQNILETDCKKRHSEG